ncbi:phosphotransferase enzyme family protein [Frigidibacter oleivorans]|uniref:phosphotransferase enzyme family protein n=1 Tax=Frigidibacter oleivorans TaxID=2487129 RepID=UPI000F8DFF8C|nr:phosphotransferase [Frigidibacter oleivorans]
MSGVVETALAQWGFDGAACRLVAARENKVYRVDHEGAAYALRLHRPGYCSEAELRSELQWMAAADAGGLHVPAPVASGAGAYLHIIDGVAVDVLRWLEGQPLGKTGVPLELDDRTGLFRAIGREMARLHEVSDAWTPPGGFTRRRWDRDGLLGDAPVWDRFWDNPTLSPEDRALFLRLRKVATAELTAREADLDYGLIHADLVRENLLINGDRVNLIDFDDSGFGFRLFDIATTLLRNRTEPDFEALKAALLDGYLSVRDIDLAALDLFVVLRAATYVGWIISRMTEDGAAARNARYIDTARGLTEAYLSRKGG